MRFGSLFSGVGLLDVGLAQAGIEHAWFCESDPWRREVLAKRWPGVPVFEDVRQLGAGNAELVDGIVGGFPCKGASTAGKRNGFDHPETVLWREMARIVGELRPRYVIVENVSNLLTIKKGLVWQEVLQALAALGFDVVWENFPASAFGAPHRRDRVVAIACHPGGGGWGPDEQHLRAGKPDPARCAEDAAHATWYGEGGSSTTSGADGERVGPGLDALADSARELERVANGQADSVSGSGRAWPLPLVGSDFAAPDADSAGREGYGRSGRVSAQVSGATAGDAQTATDAGGERRQQVARSAHGDEAPDAGRRAKHDHEPAGAREGWVSTASDEDAPNAASRSTRHDAEDAARGLATESHGSRGVAVEWGEYEPAIRRWEAIHGPAPEPLIRRLDDGDPKLRRVRARVDRSRLSALGDGVFVPLGRLAGEYVVYLEQQRKLQQGERTHA